MAFKDAQVPTNSAKQNKRSRVEFFLSEKMSFLNDNLRHAENVIDTMEWDSENSEDDVENDSENNEHNQNQEIAKNDGGHTGQKGFKINRFVIFFALIFFLFRDTTDTPDIHRKYC